MDQLALFGQLDKVAVLCRRFGLSCLPPMGSPRLKPLIGNGPSIQVDGFDVNASVEHRHDIDALHVGEIESSMANLISSVETASPLTIVACGNTKKRARHFEAIRAVKAAWGIDGSRQI
ncbi:MAG TPA: hypothetical protein VIM04_05635 [Candidatus Binatia bacterium]